MEINENQSFRMNLALEGRFTDIQEFLEKELKEYADKGIKPFSK